MNGICVSFIKDIYTETHLKKLGLNQRQVKAIFFVKENGKITNGEYQKLNDISHRTAARDLTELVEKGILESSGSKGAGSFYNLK